jgi:hypothetical protein
MGREVKAVVAEVAGPEERRRGWALLIAQNPAYERYQYLAGRALPVVILRPVKEPGETTDS